MITNLRFTESGEKTNLHRLLLVGAGLAFVSLVIYWPGCRHYPAVSSKENLVLVKLLYSACNTKDVSRLAKVEERVERAQRDGKQSRAERDAFSKIIAWARQGEWDRAEKAAFKFAQDQVGVGHPAP